MKEDISQNDLNTLERVIDRVFAKIGIDVEFTRHFLDRVNDPRNKEQITMRELGMLFAKEYQKWGRPIAKLGPNSEAVMKDLASDINIPFALQRRGNGLELVAKTVMRKKNFRTPDREFKVEADEVEEAYGAAPSVSGISYRARKRRLRQKYLKLTGIPAEPSWNVTTLRTHIKNYNDNPANSKIRNEADQVRGSESTPKKSKPSTTGSQPHPYRGRLVGEAVREMWETYQRTDELIDPREAMMTSALKYLHKMITKDTGRRHTEKGHALHVLQAFNMPDLNPRALMDLYNDWKQSGAITEGWMEKNFYYIDENIDQEVDEDEDTPNT